MVYVVYKEKAQIERRMAIESKGKQITGVRRTWI